MDDALCAGVAGVGLAIATGSLRLTALLLIPSVACLTGTTSERALIEPSHQVTGAHIGSVNMELKTQCFRQQMKEKYWS